VEKPGNSSQYLALRALPRTRGSNDQDRGMKFPGIFAHSIVFEGRQRYR